MTAGDVVLTYLVTNDLQLDVAYFRGFSGIGLNQALTVGVGVRF